MAMVTVSFWLRMMPQDLHMLLTEILFCIITGSVNVVSLKPSVDTQTLKNWATCYGFQ